MRLQIVDMHVNLWPGKLTLLQKKIKLLPVKAFPLTPPVEPLEQQPGSIEEEIAEHLAIVGYPVVVVAVLTATPQPAPRQAYSGCA